MSLLGPCYRVYSVSVDKPRRLTDQHWAFVQAYVRTRDPASAMVEAGYQHKDQTVRQIAAYRLLRRPDIQGALKMLAQAEMDQVELDRTCEIPGYKTMIRKYAPTNMPQLGRLQTREGRAEYLASIALGEAEEDIPWKDRLNAMRMLGQMHGDYVARKVIAYPDGAPQHQHVHVTLQEAKDVARGKKLPEEVLNVEEEHEDSGGDPGDPGDDPGDAVDLLLQDGEDRDDDL